MRHAHVQSEGCWVEIEAASRAPARLDVAVDGGFTLIEVMVALMLTIMVMTATAGFFVRGLAATRLMQQRQSAVAVAEQAMEKARATPPSHLGDPANSDTSTDVAVGNISYSVRTQIAECWIAAPTTPPTANPCSTYTALRNMWMYRITVTASWPPRAGVACAGASECSYQVTTLRDPNGMSTEDLREPAAGP